MKRKGLTCTLCSFQNEGSSENSKLWACRGTDTTDPVTPPLSSSSQSSILRAADMATKDWAEARLWSRETDFSRSGVLGTDSETDRSWNPNRLLIALAVSDRKGILSWLENLGQELGVKGVFGRWENSKRNENKKESVYFFLLSFLPSFLSLFFFFLKMNFWGKMRIRGWEWSDGGDRFRWAVRMVWIWILETVWVLKRWIFVGERNYWKVPVSNGKMMNTCE